MLYRDLSGPITGYLASRGAAEPEDLAGEVFYSVARSIHGFDGDESSFRSWVFVISHRKLIDERRRTGRRPTSVEISPQILSASEGGDVEGEAVSNLVTGEITDALQRLTEGQREVLALRLIAGLTLAETARVLGKRVGAIKALQRRALAALEGELEIET